MGIDVKRQGSDIAVDLFIINIDAEAGKENEMLVEYASCLQTITNCTLAVRN